MCLKNPNYRSLFFPEMSRLKTILAALLFACWIPATSLCLLERAGWIACNDDGCPVGESSQSSACCVLSSPTYKLDGNQRPAVAVPGDLPVLLVGLVEPQSNQSPSLESGVSPPEVCTSWQFSSRAASAPRAPSIAS